MARCFQGVFCYLNWRILNRECLESTVWLISSWESCSLSHSLTLTHTYKHIPAHSHREHPHDCNTQDSVPNEIILLLPLRNSSSQAPPQTPRQKNAAVTHRASLTSGPPTRRVCLHTLTGSITTESNDNHHMPLWCGGKPRSLQSGSVFSRSRLLSFAFKFWSASFARELFLTASKKLEPGWNARSSN